MKQYEYFAADYRTGKKQLKRDFAHDTVALFENENATLNDIREGRKALKAKYKADKRTLKKRANGLKKISEKISECSVVRLWRIFSTFLKRLGRCPTAERLSTTKSKLKRYSI